MPGKKHPGESGRLPLLAQAIALTLALGLTSTAVRALASDETVEVQVLDRNRDRDCFLGNLNPTPAPVGQLPALRDTASQPPLEPVEPDLAAAAPESDAEFSRAGLKDVLGTFFFPSASRVKGNPKRHDGFKELLTTDREPGNLLRSSRKIQEEVARLTPEQRRALVTRYVAGVTSHFADSFPETEKMLASRFKKPKDEQVLAVQKRLRELRDDPRQKELLTRTLLAWLPEYAQQYQAVKPDRVSGAKACLAAGLGLGCIAFAMDPPSVSSLADLLRFPVDLNIDPNGAGIFKLFSDVFMGMGLPAYVSTRPLRRIRYRWEATRAARAALRGGTLAEQEDLALESRWKTWGETGLALAESQARRAAPVPAEPAAVAAVLAERVDDNRFRLVNTGEMLGLIVRERSPGGGDFSGIVKANGHVKDEVYSGVEDGLARRLQQLDRLELELGLEKTDILGTLDKSPETAEALRAIEGQDYSKGDPGALPEEARNLSPETRIILSQVQTVRRLAYVASMRRETFDQIGKGLTEARAARTAPAGTAEGKIRRIKEGLAASAAGSATFKSLLSGRDQGAEPETGSRGLPAVLSTRFSPVQEIRSLSAQVAEQARIFEAARMGSSARRQARRRIGELKERAMTEVSAANGVSSRSILDLLKEQSRARPSPSAFPYIQAVLGGLSEKLVQALSTELSEDRVRGLAPGEYLPLLDELVDVGKVRFGGLYGQYNNDVHYARAWTALGQAGELLRARTVELYRRFAEDAFAVRSTDDGYFARQAAAFETGYKNAAIGMFGLVYHDLWEIADRHSQRALRNLGMSWHEHPPAPQTEL